MKWDGTEDERISADFGNVRYFPREDGGPRPEERLLTAFCRYPAVHG